MYDHKQELENGVPKNSTRRGSYIPESAMEMFGIRVQKYVANLCSRENLGDLFFEYFLPASQVIAIAEPFIWARPGAYLSQYPTIGFVLIGIIFLVLGLKLKTDEIKDALRSGHVFLVGIISSLFITGVIAAGLTGELPFDEPHTAVENRTSMFGPYEFRIGVMLYYSVPCTITAGIVLVQQAEGNLPMAGAIATVANVIGCYTTPILLQLFLAKAEGKFDVASVLIKLTFSILMPVIVGKLLQCIPAVPKGVKKVKRWISVVTSTCLALMLWMKVSKAVEEDAFAGMKWQSLLILVGIVIVMCMINLTVNVSLSALLCLRHAYVRVMILMVSQKTLVMAITLVQILPESIGNIGLIMVPLFVAHPTQIMVFSMIAPQLKKHPFDFNCPRFFPTKIVALCDWLNSKKEEEPPALSGVVIENPEADVVTTQPTAPVDKV